LPREEWRCPHRQGKKVVTTLLRRCGRGEDVLRADQPITRGRLGAGWDRKFTEIKATLKARQERQVRHFRRWDHLWLGQASLHIPLPCRRATPATPPVQVCQRDGR
jgi:hypothetical protein